MDEVNHIEIVLLFENFLEDNNDFFSDFYAFYRY